MRTLHSGDRVPHFEVIDIGGHAVRYLAIWQVHSLVLVCLPADRRAAGEDYAARLLAGLADLSAAVTCVMTHDSVAGVDAPAVIIADQWGEVVHVATVTRPEDLPDPEELRDWIQFLRVRCPECRARRGDVGISRAH